MSKFMSKFKVGDRVKRLVDGYHPARFGYKGQIGTVVEQRSTGRRGISVEWDEPKEGQKQPSKVTVGFARFEKLEDAGKPKPRQTETAPKTEGDRLCEFFKETPRKAVVTPRAKEYLEPGRYPMGDAAGELYANGWKVQPHMRHLLGISVVEGTDVYFRFSYRNNTEVEPICRITCLGKEVRWLEPTVIPTPEEALRFWKVAAASNREL